jgi:hypothetical protein
MEDKEFPDKEFTCLGGRFSTRDRTFYNPIWLKMDEEARQLGANWSPLQAGFFGGSLERYLEISDALAKTFQKQRGIWI